VQCVENDFNHVKGTEDIFRNDRNSLFVSSVRYLAYILFQCRCYDSCIFFLFLNHRLVVREINFVFFSRPHDGINFALIINYNFLIDIPCYHPNIISDFNIIFIILYITLACTCVTFPKEVASSKVRLDAFRVSRRIFRSLSKPSNRVPITGSVVRVRSPYFR